MNGRRSQTDELIDAHLGLFAAVPASEIQEAQERARVRLLEEIQRRPLRAAAPTFVWGRDVVFGLAAVAVFVLTLQAPAIWQAITSPRPAGVVSSVGPYPVSEGGVATGRRIGIGEVARSDEGAGTQLVLPDGSEVEMRADSELLLDRAADGLAIRLHTGSIIVNAAKQGSGHLYVQTKDVTVTVVGTIFLVNAEDDGSKVAVIEGEVRVHEGPKETRLRPGEQVSTSPKLVVRPVREEVAWSRNVEAINAILATFEKGMSLTAGPRTKLADPLATAQGAGPISAPARPEFEEASIRPCDPDNIPAPPEGARGGGPNSLQMTPGRTHVLCMTLATIIRTAYGYAPANAFSNAGRARGFNYTNVYGLGVEDGRRVRGGPDWVRSERYTIDAVAAGAADAASMSGPMLRALLEKRFQLQAHIDSEQIPAFDLVVAPGGLKMKEGTCTPSDVPRAPGTPGSTMDVVRKNLEAARRGATTAAPCGLVFAANGPNMLTVGAGAGLPALGGLFGVPVTDKTGIPATARFNYALEFSRDDSMTGPLARIVDAATQGTGPDVQIAADPSAVAPASNLFTVLEQQLGLRLVPAKAPQEFIVIDRVERPRPD
jgi:uncharacterized protein (TIGR03435 family)